MLARDAARAPFLQQALGHGDASFLWAPVSGAPANLPLWQLMDGNVQNLARNLSCGQNIAGDSAFSLGMVAEFEGQFTGVQAAAWRYPRLFWEAGILGQVGCFLFLILHSNVI